MIHFSEDGILISYEQWLNTLGLKKSSVWDEMHFIRMLPGLHNETEDRVIAHRIDRLAESREWKSPTSYKCRCAVKRHFYWIYEWEKLKEGRTPYQKFYARKGPKPEPAFLTDEQIQKIIGNPFISVRDSVLVRCTYYSGCRRSEICALNVEDFRDGQFHVRHGKGDLWRWVQLDPQTATLVTIYIEGLKAAGHGNPKDPLFVVQGYRRMTPHRMWKRIQYLGELVGLKCRPHVLRHSIARTILLNGGNLPAIQTHLGHRSSSQTLSYSHLLPADVKRYLS